MCIRDSIWVTVVTVAPSSVRLVSPGQPESTDNVTIEGTGKYGKVRMTVPKDKLLRQGFDAESKQAQLKQAIAYQATLTVKGKVSKVAPRAA